LKEKWIVKRGQTERGRFGKDASQKRYLHWGILIAREKKISKKKMRGEEIFSWLKPREKNCGESPWSKGGARNWYSQSSAKKRHLLRNQKKRRKEVGKGRRKVKRNPGRTKGRAITVAPALEKT